MKLLAVLLASLALTSIALGQETPAEHGSDAEPLVLALELERLPLARDESSADRVESIAHLAYARMLEQRRDLRGSLRHLQRAYRYDSSQSGVLRQIVNLALELKRPDEACRYAAIASETSLDDLLVLRRLAVHASSKRDWPLAIRLYEASIRRQQARDELEATYILMQSELARLYFLQENYVAAHKAFGIVRAALKNPTAFNLSESMIKVMVADAQETNSLMARVALEARQFDEAQVLFDLCHLNHEDDTATAIDQARVAVGREDWPLVQKLLQQIFASGDFESKVPLDLLRRMLASQHVNDLATIDRRMVEILRPVVQQNPENEAVRIAYLRALLDLSELQEAKDALQATVEKKQMDEFRIIELSLRRKQKDANAWLGVVATIDRAEIDSLSDELAHVIADSDFAMALLAAAEADGVPLHVKQVAAHIALENKLVDRAAKLFDDSLPEAKQAKADLLISWAVKLLQKDYYAESAAALERIMNERLLTKPRASLFFYLAGSYALSNQTDKALIATRRAIELDPDEPRYLSREAWILERMGSLAEARKIYDSLLAKFDSAIEPHARSAIRDAHLMASNLCHQLGDAKAADEHLERVLDEFPEDVGASNDLAYIWSERSVHLQRALRMIDMAVKAEPSNKAYRDTRGWILFRLGRNDEAIAEIELASSEGKPDGVVLDHLGDAYAKAGRSEEAKASWKRASEAYQTSGKTNAAAKVDAKLRP